LEISWYMYWDLDIGNLFNILPFSKLISTFDLRRSSLEFQFREFGERSKSTPALTKNIFLKKKGATAKCLRFLTWVFGNKGVGGKKTLLWKKI